MLIKIYGLFDPRNNELRYVGQTSRSLNDRLSKHLSGSKNNSDPNPVKKAWINKLLKLNMKPSINLLGIIEENESIFWEQWNINDAKFNGCRLTNYAPAKGGHPRKHTKESIAEYKKNWAIKNKEKVKENHKLWRNKNKKHLRKYSREKAREFVLKNGRDHINFLQRLNWRRNHVK